MKVREKMFSTLDLLIGKIIESLRAIEGVLYFEVIRRDLIVFSLPLSPLTKKMKTPLKIKIQITLTLTLKKIK
jgi:hypothetical protein